MVRCPLPIWALFCEITFHAPEYFGYPRLCTLTSDPSLQALEEGGWTGNLLALLSHSVGEEIGGEGKGYLNLTLQDIIHCLLKIE